MGTAAAHGGATPWLSIVSPVYLGEEALHPLVASITEHASRVTQDFEIILVEDGSPDDSWQRIVEACEADQRVKGVRLSRNFGQHYAISAGLATAQGTHVIVLDCDLQDDPKHIPELIAKAREGYDIVYTMKRKRAHGWARNVIGKLYHKTLDMLAADWVSQSAVGSYSLLTRPVVDSFLKMKDYHRHYLGLLRWLGFKNTCIEIEHCKRIYGKSSYTLRKLIVEALSGLTSQTDRLLRIAIAFGFFFVSISVIAAVYLVVAYFLHGFKEGWTSVIVLNLLCTGVVLVSMGITGVYVGKIFDQTKNRPLYVVRQRLNLEE